MYADERMYADVGTFLQQNHSADLKTAMEELEMCANTRIPISSCCMPCPNDIVVNNQVNVTVQVICEVQAFALELKRLLPKV